MIKQNLNEKWIIYEYYSKINIIYKENSDGEWKR
jgi:hypothetical protein